jgi:hypothetical protein
LIASNTARKIQKPRERWGGGGLCSSGVPRPSGAGVTRHRSLLCSKDFVGTGPSTTAGSLAPFFASGGMSSVQVVSGANVVQDAAGTLKLAESRERLLLSECP